MYFNLQMWAQIINFQITNQIPYPLDYQKPLKMIINFTTFLLTFRSLKRIHEIGITEVFTIKKQEK